MEILTPSGGEHSEVHDEVSGRTDCRTSSFSTEETSIYKTYEYTRNTLYIYLNVFVLFIQEHMWSVKHVQSSRQLKHI